MIHPQYIPVLSNGQGNLGWEATKSVSFSFCFTKQTMQQPVCKLHGIVYSFPFYKPYTTYGCATKVQGTSG